MSIRLLLLVALFGLAFVTAPARAQDVQSDEKTVRGSHIQFGKDFYPTDLYPPGANTYLILDKENTDADSSFVFRDHGNARAEIGIIGDNDLHIKTVSGTYGAETFTDRLLIRAKSGEVDSFGTIFRQYAATGRPTIVIGNSDLAVGAGLELTYDQDEKFAEISSVDHANGDRGLAINSNGVKFYHDDESDTAVASISGAGAVTTPSIISGGEKFTVSGCAASEAVGGAAAGRFKSGTTGACIVTITINGKKGMTAPNGWACSGTKLTTANNSVGQTASTTTTATLAVTTTTNDVISFYCMGY